MGNPMTVAANTAGFTGATATLSNFSNDRAGVVTFTTSSTIPASPYKLFTLTFGGSWASALPIAPVVLVGASSKPSAARTQAQMAAVAALGPFYAIVNAAQTAVDVYCTNAPAASTAYDIGYIAETGP